MCSNNRAVPLSMTVYWLLLGMLCSLALCLPGLAFAQPEDSATPSAGDLVAGSILVAQEGEGGQAAVSYTYDAQQYKPGENAYPGVYAVKVNANTAAETIGISRIADKTLAEAPTLESPAIICGGAVGYETIEHVRAFEAPNDQRVAPYSYFKYSILDEVAQDGSHHKKLSGFDGTYVIVRIDVSELFANLPSGVSSEDAVLHVKQEKNNALLVAVGQEGDKTNYNTFSNIVAQSDGSNVQVKVGAYKLGAMKDSGANDPDKATPYFDVILFSTASIVSGADAQKEGALNGDVDLSFYIDSATDYTPDAPAYDPTKTFTDPNEEKAYIQSFYDRFYDESKATAAGAAISHYTVKGSDLALETMVEKSGGDNKDAGTTYWSLEKSLQKPYYNLPADNSATDSGCGRTVKLMSEVPIIDNLALEGASDTQLKKRTLDVNSFDIQVANNKTESPGEYKSGLAVKNAWLKIEDLSNTTGAELAIGNNATLTIDSGGKLIVDKTCQLEIEWDGATVAPTEGEPAPTPDTLNNGLLDLRAGGELVNDGVISVEGTEGKPYQPEGEQQASESEKGYGELTILQGAKLTNNGCLSVNGVLYNLGTLINNGKYDESPIVSNDPDRGQFTYHRDTQLSWKDDVQQKNVVMGTLRNGQDRAGAVYAGAVFQNNGDVILNPGQIFNYATINNAASARMLLCAATEAIIPIEPTAEAPTVVTKRITLNPPVGSQLTNFGTIVNDGQIMPGTIELKDNTSFGTLAIPGEHPELFKFDNQGKVTNNGVIWSWPLPKPEKAANVLKAKGQTVKVKSAKLKKKGKVTIAMKKAVKVTQNESKGQIVYKKQAGNSKIAVASSGKITVKKGLKKGKTYKVTVLVNSKETDTYKAASVKATFKVKIV